MGDHNESCYKGHKAGIKRVNLADAAEADWLFTVLMGEEVAPRRKFIQAHAKEVLNLDV